MLTLWVPWILLASLIFSSRGAREANFSRDFRYKTLRKNVLPAGLVVGEGAIV